MIPHERILKANADRVSGVASVASGYGKYGLANQLWAFEAELRARAQDLIRQKAEARRAADLEPSRRVDEGRIARIIRDRIQTSERTQASIAEAIGTSEKHLSQILTGKAQASFGLLNRLLSEVGLQLDVAPQGDDQ